ncbi:Mitochondrial substrate carrier family protein [Striga hermonthica]|uniref:Mitochondrial substrate carrier family protein n=1 Tax=Striga hermonthica TaxID=68872 RepID=A0A9N7NWI5_STRHE|nr:Mitochondrial substrate carrier family protein [Striga hermonthica]
MAVDHPIAAGRSDHNQLLVWREFLWGAIAGAFGEGMMHPVDTIKTRIQSQAIFSGGKHQSTARQLVRAVWTTDGLQGLYRGITPGVMGSLATGATYFGVIESTKKWMDESYPNIGGHWAHFISGALGDTLGSVIYVPCEVMKQRMQVQGSKQYWTSVVAKKGSHVNHGMPVYGYYTGMFQAGCSIWKEQGMKGLYAGYWSTLARDVPFAGLMVTFYEAFKNVAQYGKHKLLPNSNFQTNSSFEGLVLGGLAGGLSAYLTTPLDVVKTRLQVQGTVTRYNGWLDALCKVWYAEGVKGMFRGGVPRLMWYIPASALTFMAVEFLRDQHHKVTSISIDKKESPLQEIS